MRPLATNVARTVVYVSVCLRVNLKHALDVVHIGNTWRIQLNDLFAAAMRTYAKLLWLFVTPPHTVEERSIVISMPVTVCLSVCLSSSKSPKLHIRSFTKSLFTLSMAVARFCFGGIAISYIGYFRAPKCANSYAKPKGSLGGTDLYLICSLNQSPAYAARPWTVHRTACLFTPQLSAVVNYAVWWHRDNLPAESLRCRAPTGSLTCTSWSQVRRSTRLRHHVTALTLHLTFANLVNPFSKIHP